MTGSVFLFNKLLPETNGLATATINSDIVEITQKPQSIDSHDFDGVNYGLIGSLARIALFPDIPVPGDRFPARTILLQQGRPTGTDNADDKVREVTEREGPRMDPAHHHDARRRAGYSSVCNNSSVSCRTV